MTDGDAVVRQLHAAWERGEFGIEYFHPEVEWSTPHPGGVVRGREELQAFLRSFMGAWSEYSNELEEIHSLPDGRVLALFHEYGRGRTSGVETRLEPGALIELRDGLIYRYTGLERDDALREAGLA
jgi:ketosteroid isomerase-like protein